MADKLLCSERDSGVCLVIIEIKAFCNRHQLQGLWFSEWLFTSFQYVLKHLAVMDVPGCHFSP